MDGSLCLYYYASEAAAEWRKNINWKTLVFEKSTHFQNLDILGLEEVVQPLLPLSDQRILLFAVEVLYSQILVGQITV